MSLEELELMRIENDERLRELEEVYMKKKVNSGVGRKIREKMGLDEKVDFEEREEYEEEEEEV